MISSLEAASVPEDPLRSAAANGQLDLMKQLVEAGADYNAAGGSSNCTPLMEAIRSRHKEVALFLLGLEGIDATTPDSSMNTPLQIASSSAGYLQVVKSLISAGADVNAVGGWDHYSSLALALSRGNVDVALFLLGVEGIDVRVGMTTTTGSSFVLAATEGANFDPENTVQLLETLYERFGFPIDAVSDLLGMIGIGGTPFHSAVRGKFNKGGEIIKWFLSKGVDVDSGLIIRTDATDPRHDMPHPIEMANSTQTIAYLINAGATISSPAFALRLCRPFSRDLHHLAEVIQLLLDTGVDAELLDQERRAGWEGQMGVWMDALGGDLTGDDS